MEQVYDKLNELSASVMASNIIQVAYFIIIGLLLLIIAFKKEDFIPYDAGASQRFATRLSSTNQEDVRFSNGF